MPDAIQETWQRIVSEFFPYSTYTPTCEMDVEAYTDGDMSSPDYKSEIWIPVEKK
jgi:AraC family transcriptional regulator